MIIEQASIQDLGAILALQKLAYRDEAALYDDYTIPPLTQTLEQIQKDFASQLFLKATVRGRIIGSVRAQAVGTTCCIGRLIVHPEFRNRGIGTQLMREIEERFQGLERFELFTGEKSERNLHLYHKLDYEIFKKQRLSNKVTLVYLEKLSTNKNKP
jgi:ribosomal protein S18 acetylase RimI-like enzyme